MKEEKKYELVKFVDGELDISTIKENLTVWCEDNN